MLKVEGKVLGQILELTSPFHFETNSVGDPQKKMLQPMAERHQETSATLLSGQQSSFTVVSMQQRQQAWQKFQTHNKPASSTLENIQATCKERAFFIMNKRCVAEDSNGKVERWMNLAPSLAKWETLSA